MSWLEKLLPPRIKRSETASRKSVPEGLWVKCPSCEAVLYRTDLESNIHVCPKCNHHLRIRARERLDALLDPEGRYDIGQETLPVDTLKFKDSKKYPDRLKAALEATGEGSRAFRLSRRGSVPVARLAGCAVDPRRAEADGTVGAGILTRDERGH